MNPFREMLEMLEQAENKSREFNDEWNAILEECWDKLIKLADEYGKKREEVVKEAGKACIDAAFRGLDDWQDYLDSKEASK